MTQFVHINILSNTFSSSSSWAASRSARRTSFTCALVLHHDIGGRPAIDLSLDEQRAYLIKEMDRQQRSQPATRCSRLTGSVKLDDDHAEEETTSLCWFARDETRAEDERIRLSCKRFPCFVAPRINSQPHQFASKPTRIILQISLRDLSSAYSLAEQQRRRTCARTN